MKEGWEIKKLGEVSEIMNGGTPKTNIAEYWDGDIHWITPADLGKLKKPTVDNTPRKITRLGLEKSSAKLFSLNSVILSTRAPIGHLAINEVPMSTNQGCRGIVPSKNLDTWFLYYFLKNNVELLDSLGTGATFKELSTKALAGVEIPLPPLHEQQRIVEILDEAFAAIAKAKANAEQNLKNTKELFESYLQEVFENGDWETTTFDEVCEISSKLIDPRKPEYQNLIHVGAGNIESITGRLSDLMTAKEEGLISGKFLFDESMVLYSKIRPYLMKVVNCDFQGLCSADIYPLKPFENVITKNYLYHLLLTKEFTDYAILGSQRAGMPKVNREHLFAYTFKLPPLTEQETIVRQLNALRVETQRLEGTYRKKLEDLEELKKSILQKAFRGELKTEEAVAV
jgi:type I restriction enzyme, S subunit